MMRKLKTLGRTILSSFSWARRKPKTFRLGDIGDNVVVIANGPSLSETDLRSLGDVTKIGMNRIYLSDREDIRPDVIVVINRLIIEQYSEELCQLDIPVVTKWEFRRLFLGKTDNIHYINGSLSRYFLKWPSRVLFGHTVTNVALQLAFDSSARNIFIVGMDHNFSMASKTDRNREEVRTNEIDADHFLPNYFPKGSRWETPDLISSENEYKILKDYAERLNKSILDCTIRGKCKIFERGEWCSIRKSL